MAVRKVKSERDTQLADQRRHSAQARLARRRDHPVFAGRSSKETLMWGTIISGVTSIAGDFMAQRKAKAESKARIAEARLNAEIQQIERSAQAVVDYDIQALKETRYSWKDEVALAVVLFPFVGAFLPWTQEYVKEGFIFLRDHTPDWYSYIFCGAIAASMGIRWAVSGFSKKK